MAKAIFGSGSFYIQIGDHLAELLREVNGIDLPRLSGKFVPAAACLPLITIFQYIEQLTDSQASEAIRLRLDWKYALHLQHNYSASGMGNTVYCLYRHQALNEPALQHEIGLIYQRLQAAGLWKDCLYGHPTVLQLLTNVCKLNRLAAVNQAIAEAIEALAIYDPERLRTMVLPHWYLTYLTANRPSDRHAFGPKPYLMPLSDGQTIGADIVYLLQACRKQDDAGLQALPEISHLQQVLHAQYELYQETASCTQSACWLEQACRSCPPSGSAAAVMGAAHNHP